MIHPGSLVWFARHESRLTWRDWLSMMTAGGRWRKQTVAIAIVGFIGFLHLLALSMVGRFAEITANPGKATLLIITAIMLLSWSLMVSQAMESVTRVFYSRSDLDLILSSPAAAQKIFAVRIATIALSVATMSMLLAAPFINILAIGGGLHWLGGYGVVMAMGTTATALAVALTTALLRTIGPARTRFVAQIVAAVVGAIFVISLQVAAIMSTDSLSRFSILQSEATVALAPNLGSVAWWPARAILGDARALIVVMAGSLASLLAAILAFSGGFGNAVMATASVPRSQPRPLRRVRPFRLTSPQQALRRKEWTLLRRDPWLMSQSLMQVLYLLPPALLLWRSYGDGSGASVLVVPVLVMAAGQLAGGLAWLAISGEDAPDLVASAPVPSSRIMRAKVEAVMGAVALVFTPFVVAVAFASPFNALVSGASILIAAASATAIQLWFRAQAKRSQFRRRQTSSRLATFAEAFSSITWAAAAAFAAADFVFALIMAAIALLILGGARLLSPRQT